MTAENTVTFKKGEGQNFVPSFEYLGDNFVIDGNLAYSDSRAPMIRWARKARSIR